ncbi:snRNA-activating protein complex subunit (SNAPc subunit) (Protein SHOOT REDIFFERENTIATION DEFECTIVE 2) [Durusdinium trenchii]|uniref:snRNA-activating protein complex subunit (SNAPc subunit) (Protein SHOOT REDIFFERENTIATION DEFECTIVE 2) n=1 Tax=Durusdinium trenchii TaxID=1381693 RepID=A0ABP0H8Z4_9DINO
MDLLASNELNETQKPPTDIVEWSKRARDVLDSLSFLPDLGDELDIEPLEPVEKHDSQKSFSKRSDTAKNFQSEEVFRNAVQGCPHGRWVDRMLKRCKAESQAQLPPELSRVSAEDVILTVMLCDQKGCKEQEYDVLASQTLHDLRDALYFVGDWMYDGPSRRSACMFIDGIFYSDMRESSALDYSKELVEWIKKAGHIQLKEECSRTMEARFCDLDRIPFGEKCCFIRQGDIEHLMYFTDARLLNPKVDCPLRDAYPCLIWMRRYRKRCCVVCKKMLASWVVLDSSRCPFNPAYFCRCCFEHFSQNERGECIPPMDYQVFPYLHDEF